MATASAAEILPPPTAEDLEKNIVVLQNVVVSFDGFRALDINQFAVERNELRVVIGPNGAGKTTLCDVISGKTRIVSGRLYFDRHDIRYTRDTEIARLGVGRKFQTPTIFDSLTVYENMQLALPGGRNVFQCMFRRETPRERDQILSILNRVRLLEDVSTPAKYLSHGQRQWLEISMLIVAEPKLLLVDEPAAGLSDKETELTAQLLLELRGHHTIIVIEHDMDFVRRISTKITVLDNGKVLAEGSMKEVSENPVVIEAYLGR
ncbi:MAG: urea ABC transporter ATP-binding protein UrtD [Planctomycetota bacterium]|nr:urea ABC transporter ATP-binding protein UrtD [Planctomycetota bacterium]